MVLASTETVDDQRYIDGRLTTLCWGGAPANASSSSSSSSSTSPIKIGLGSVVIPGVYDSQVQSWLGSKQQRATSRSAAAGAARSATGAMQSAGCPAST